jgi:predicted nucleic acid-binding protein
MAIIADTGGILVFMDKKDPKHQAAFDCLDEKLIVPSLILPEVDYLSSTRLARGATQKILDGLFIGEFEYHELDLFDLQMLPWLLWQNALKSTEF